MKILLHICCAPCAIHPLRELLDKRGDSVSGFFYNPNIHPSTEMEKRRQAVKEYCEESGFEVDFGGYDIEDYFRAVSGDLKVPGRCHACWSMRLSKTAGYAREKGYDAFTTTLLVSPYQDQDAIMRIGREAGTEHSVEFLGRDFREGFRQAQQEARELGVYRQRYCGCVFSEVERYCKKETDAVC